MTEAEVKLKFAERCLEAGELWLVLDARQPGVSVPRAFAEENPLLLKFSHRYGTAIEVTTWGIKQQLSFAGSQFRVSVPWSAVYQAASQRLAEAVAWEPPAPPPKTEPTKPAMGLRLLAKEDES